MVREGIEDELAPGMSGSHGQVRVGRVKSDSGRGRCVAGPVPVVA